MKVLRQLCAITVLTIVFAQTAAAEEGVIHPGIMPPPPPPPALTGVIHPGLVDPAKESIDKAGTFDLATEITLSVVQNLLALF
jgi:hypothetical protein